MLGKLVSVVHRQGVDAGSMRGQEFDEDIGDLAGVLGRDGLDTGEAALMLDDRQQRAAAVAAHHQVDFPVAYARFLVDEGRSLINGHALRDSPSIGGCRKGPPCPVPLTELRIQGPAGVSVGANVLINTLMREQEPLLAGEPIGNLLWTPLLAQFAFD